MVPKTRVPSTPVWEVTSCSWWRRFQDLASPALLVFGSLTLCKPQPFNDPPPLGTPSVSLLTCRGCGGQDSRPGLGASWVGAESPCSRTAEGASAVYELPTCQDTSLQRAEDGVPVRYRSPGRVCALVSDIIKVCWPQIRNKVVHPTGFRDDLGSQKVSVQP